MVGRVFPYMPQLVLLLLYLDTDWLVLCFFPADTLDFARSSQLYSMNWGVDAQLLIKMRTRRRVGKGKVSARCKLATCGVQQRSSLVALMNMLRNQLRVWHQSHSV